MEQFETAKIRRIREQYTERTATKFEELKALDMQVKAPAEIFAYVFGGVGSLVLGTGMSLAMRIIGTSLAFGMPLGIVIGCVGLAMVSVNYSFYKGILKSRKAKYAKEILALSDELLNK
ncbi:MAG: dihydropteridine reductase [Clostridia bacterium]|nr:dihydropteridine reductase [Clostridia bacterium]